MIHKPYFKKMPLKKLCTISILLAVGSHSMLTGCNKNSNPYGPATPPDTMMTTTPPPTPPPTVAAFNTDTLLGDGVDLQPSYYNGGNVTFGFSLMQQYANIKSVRIEIEPSVAISLLPPPGSRRPLTTAVTG